MSRPLTVPQLGDSDAAPASLAVEQAILGVCLDGRHPDAWNIVLEHSAGVVAFYHRDHRLIALVIDQLAITGQRVDSLTVATAAGQWRFTDAIDALRKLDGEKGPRPRPDDAQDLADSVLAAVGYHGAISALAESYAPATGLAANANILAAYHRQRQTIAALSDMLAKARAVDGAKLARSIAAEGSTKLAAIAESGRVDDSIGLGMAAAADSHDKAMASGDQIAASWGVAALDEGCRLTRGTMVVLAARPGCGKTSLGLQSAVATRESLKSGSATAIVTREMTSEQLARIVVGRQLNIGRQAIARGWLSLEQRQALDGAIADWRQNDIPVMGHSGPGTCVEICAWIRAMFRRSQGALHLVVVDYLGLIKGTNDRQSTNDRLGEITRSLKALALELKICVLLLCQMSRESTKEKRSPELPDLRDSGNIEQDADSVVFLWSEQATDAEIMMVNAKVAKNREGPMASYGLEFLKGYGQRFRAIGDDGREPRQQRIEAEPSADEDRFQAAPPQQEP